MQPPRQRLNKENEMEKRQALMIAVLALVLAAGGGFWWFTNQAEEPADAAVTAAPPAAAAPAPATPPAPVTGPAATPAESDAVALQEEVLDKEKAEIDELAARAADLEEQVRDGELILDGKAKQIEKLEAELKRLEKENAAASKKK
jgi:hypothetical protein